MASEIRDAQVQRLTVVRDALHRGQSLEVTTHRNTRKSEMTSLEVYESKMWKQDTERKYNNTK